MHIHPPRVVRCPPNNGQIVRRRLQFRTLGDLDALGFVPGRKYVSAGSVGRDQADSDSRACQYSKQSNHGPTSNCCYFHKLADCELEKTPLLWSREQAME